MEPRKNRRNRLKVNFNTYEDRAMRRLKTDGTHGEKRGEIISIYHI